MNILKNEWIVGIGGGIISGIIVTIISNFILRVKYNKEYMQKIEIANNEIIQCIKPLISEQIKPSIYVLKSVIASISKKYNVDMEDIYNIESLCDDLIKEIIENSFLTSHKKIDFCELVLELGKAEGDVMEIEETSKMKNRNQNQMLLKFFTPLILGCVSTVIGGMIVFYYQNSIISKSFNSWDSIIFFGGIIVITITTIVLITLLEENFKKRKNKFDKVSNKLKDLNK